MVHSLLSRTVLMMSAVLLAARATSCRWRGTCQTLLISPEARRLEDWAQSAIAEVRRSGR